MKINYHSAANITLGHILEKTEQFTFPPIRKKIQTMPLQEPFIGVWATDSENRMLGMILADNKGNGVSELFSFLVIPGYRNKGIGTQLLKRLEHSLGSLNIRNIQSRYRSDWGSISYIEKLLTRAGWDPPVLFRLIVEAGIEYYPQVNWPSVKAYPGYTLFNWSELTDQDRAGINELIHKGEISREFNPFQHQDRIYSPSSFGLRKDREIAGWNMAYALKADTIEYNNLFIRKEYRNIGHAITLLHRSFDEQFKQNVPRATWIVNADNRPVLKFASRLAGEYADKRVEVMLCRKNL